MASLAAADTTNRATDQHDWVDVPEGSLLTSRAAFRFCSRCEREEWSTGTVRPGWPECGAQAGPR